MDVSFKTAAALSCLAPATHQLPPGPGPLTSLAMVGPKPWYSPRSPCVRRMSLAVDQVVACSSRPYCTCIRVLIRSTGV